MSDRTEPDVLFVYRELPDPLRPCFLNRHEDVTVLCVQPDTDRLALLTYFVDELTTAEQDVIRNAHGWPRVGRGSVPDSWVDGCGPLLPRSRVVPADYKLRNR